MIFSGQFFLSSFDSEDSFFYSSLEVDEFDIIPPLGLYTVSNVCPEKCTTVLHFNGEI